MGAAVHMTSYERKMRASQGGLAAAAAVGREQMTKAATRGFMARFEKQIEELCPGLRRADPRDFEQRVQDAFRSYMKGLSLKSVQSRRETKELAATVRVCGWCCAEQGRKVSANQTICRKHQQAMVRQAKKIIRERGVTLGEQWARQAIAAEADTLTDLIFADFTTNMRPWDGIEAA